MKKSLIKIIGIILTISIAVTSAAALSGCSSNDAGKATADSASVSENVKGIASPVLVKTVTEYSRNFETQEWEKARVIDYTYENGGYDEFSKFTFEYADTEISDSRYAMMIDSFLLGEANSYYRYLWY